MADTLTDEEMDQLGGMPETLTDADVDRLGGGISMDYTRGWRTGQPSTGPAQLRPAATGNSRGLMSPSDFEEPKDPVERWATRMLYAGPRLPEVLEQLTTEEGPDIRGRAEQRAMQMLAAGQGANANSPYGTRVTSALASGMAAIPRGIDRSLQMALMGDDSNHAKYLDDLTPPQRAFVTRMRQKFAEADPVAGKDTNWFTAAPIKTAEMAPQALASIGIGVYGGGVLPMAAFWFTQTYPDRYDEFRAEGLSEKTAQPAAVVSAAVESAIEIFEKNPLDAFGKKTLRTGVRKVVVEALKNYGKELSEEAMQAVTSETVKQVAARSEGQSPSMWKSVEEVARQTVDAAAPLALMMGGSAAVSESARRLSPTPPSQQDAARFVAANEEAARAIAADPNPPSRKTMEEFGFEGTNREGRAVFADHVRNMVSVLEDMKRAQADVEKLAQAPTPTDDTTQEAAGIAGLANQQEPPGNQGPDAAAPAAPVTPPPTGPRPPKGPPSMDAGVNKADDDKVTRVKMFLTMADEAQLRSLGYSQEQIDRMKPDEGQRIITNQEQAVPPVETPSPIQEVAREEEQTQTPQGRPEGLLNETRVAPDSGSAPVVPAVGGTQDQRSPQPRSGTVLNGPSRREEAGQRPVPSSSEPLPEESAPVMDLQGFASDADPMRMKNIQDALAGNVKNGNRVISRKALVEEKIASGSSVLGSPGKRRLVAQDGSYLDEQQIGKTAMDYAEHLNGLKAGQPAEPAPSTESKAVPPDLRLANSLGPLLDEARPVGAGEFFKLADEAYGGTRAEGKYGPSDAYDALELAVNQYLRRRGQELSPAVDQGAAKEIAAKLQALTDQLPTQTNRSGEKDSMQQFSTPPAYAYAANWVANIGQNDVALEPSAGTGSLAVHGMNAGAQVYVNELSKRRAQLVASLQPKQVFTENAEQIANILPGKMPAPTVVVMNPPFSQTAGRMGDKKVLTTGATHIEQALKLMAPGGRLVAIVGRGMDFSSKTFGDWWRNIAKQYNVRANIGVSGNVYKKYGTHFGTRLLVIDKTPSSGSAPVVGEANTISELIDALAGVRFDRPAPQQQPTQPTVPGTSAQSGPDSGPVVPVQPAAPAVDTGGATGRAPDAGTAAGAGALPDGGRDAGVEAGERTDVAPAGTEGTPSTPVQPDGGSTPVDRGSGGGGEPAGRDIPGQQSAGPSEPADTVAPIAVESATQAPTRRKELTESVFEPYQPAKVRIPGAKPHPASIVESAAMAAVQPPTPTYSPRLPKEVIEKGLLSAVQLETTVYAGQAHSKMLPAAEGETPTRRGFMIGDGTGVGKGREISGIILDNWMQGRKRAVWLSMNEKLFDDAKRDWSGLGQDAAQVFNLGKIKAGGDIQAKEGILFATYGALRSKGRTGKSRLEQIVDWLGKDFDGVIAFDEAHKMGNLIPMGARKSKPSKTAMAGVELQAALPNARIVYVSATAATEVANLAYADRLGLWGRGTPFPKKLDFINQIADGGVAAMELVARDMKAMGAYLARNISFNDGTPQGTVQYDRLEHVLSANQRQVYDALAEGWQSTLGAMGQALGITGGDANSDAKANVMSAFWGAHQRFFNQIITAMQTPSIINAVERDVAEGKSVVIQLTNTYEAAQERALAERDDDADLDELDISPRDALIQMVERSFPVTQYEEYVDENGNVLSRPVVDSNGNPVQNKDAVAMRDALIERLSTISTPDSPMDIIIKHFGVDNVAEVTGRGRRIVQVRQPDGSLKTEIQSRSPSARKADIDAFMGDKKRILIFSEAGGTGASYHADRSVKNQRHRMHYLLQAGWKADNAIQGLGRTHRSNQAQAPTYILVHTDLKGQKRFLSTIARRLSQLGAITKGERRASSSGIFTAADNLESVEAKEALHNFFKDLAEGNVSEIGLDDFQRQTGLKLLDKEGNLKNDLPPITQFLNRLLSLKTDTQNLVFDAFDSRLQQTVERAVSQGTLDQGTETLKADRIHKVSETTVHTDAESGAETKYVRLRVGNKVKPISWDQVKGLQLRGFYESPHGKVYAVQATDMNRTDAKTGQVERQVRLIDQSSKTFRNERNVLSSKDWQRLDQAEAEKRWNEAVAGLPQFKEHEEHLITGAILPIWDRLLGKPRVFRLLTDEGEQLLGRVVPPDMIKTTLRSLGVNETGDSANIDPRQALRDLRSGDAQVVLGNGWRMRPARVQGEQRIELIGPDFTHHNELEADGVVRERIGFKTRYFIPTGNAEQVFQSVTRYRPISEVQQLSRSSAAQDAQSAADDADPDSTGGMGITAMVPTLAGMAGADGTLVGLGIKLLSKLEPRQKVREDRVPNIVKAPRPDVEERLQKAHGVDRSSLAQKVKDFAETAWHKATRAEEHLPKNAAFAAAREFFRLLKGVPTAAADEVNRTVAAIIDPMGPNQLALFERKLIVDNMLAAADRGEPLRFGVESVEELEAYRQQLDDVIAAVPEVQQALDARKAIVHELVTDLVQHDLLPPEALGNAESYYHQQVLTYLQAGGVRGSSGAERRKRSFQRRRVRDIDSLPEEFDYNTAYIEAETRWMTEAQVELRKEKMVRKLAEKYDKLPTLKKQAFRQNLTALVGGPENMARIEALKRLIRESSESPNRNESDERLQRRTWITELTSLDPTYPMRKKIARLSDKIQRMISSGQVPLEGFTRLKAIDPDADLDLDGQWFNLLSFLAQDDTTEAGRAALGIFKAIQDRNALFREQLGNDLVTPERLLGDDLALWQPEPGNVFFRAFTLPEKIVEAVLQGTAGMLELTPDQLHAVTVMGGPRRQFAMPKALVNQLAASVKPPASGIVGKAAEEAMRTWKVWTLLNPMRAIGYTLRNMTGDLDPIIAGAPQILAHVQDIIPELQAYYRGGLAMSKDLRDARDLNVLDSALTAEEIPELRDLAIFKRFYESQTSIASLPVKMADAYFERVKRFSKFREAVLRYAAYKYYLRAVKGDSVTHFGGAKPETVRALARDLGPEVAAAHLSRNLLGDYGNLTVMGNWMRAKAMPFYSWMEVNAKRYPRMLTNAVEYGRTKGDGKLSARAAYTGMAIAGIATLTTLMYLWNHFVHPDEEKDLNSADQANPHIIVKRNDDGTAMILRNTGALGDFLEWFGIPTLASLYPQYAADQLTLSDLVTEMAKAPVNKLVQSFRPDIKGMFEIASGVSTYPDVFNPRSAPRDELAAETVGLRDAYRATAGRLTDSGARGRSHWLGRLIGISDPRRAALQEIYDLRERFLTREGKATQGMLTGEPKFRNMREAAIDDDYAAFVEARRAYLQGKSYDNFKRSLQSVDPIAQRLSDADEKRFAEDFLTGTQRERLKLARDFAGDTAVKMWAWWQRASEEGDSPEGKAQTEQAVTEEIGRKAATLARPRPVAVTREQRAAGKTIRDVQAEWQADVDESLAWLQKRGIDAAQARKAYQRHLYSEVKSTDARAAHMRRFMGQVVKLRRAS